MSLADGVGRELAGHVRLAVGEVQQEGDILSASFAHQRVRTLPQFLRISAAHYLT
jgi:hypothetical protein